MTTFAPGTAIRWPDTPPVGSVVRGKFWSYTTDEEGYWGAYHQRRPDRREFCSNPLNALHAYGPFQVTVPDGSEYIVAVPDAPPVGTRVKGGTTGKVYELVGAEARPDIFAKLRQENGSAGEWVSALQQEATMTVLPLPAAEPQT